MSSPTHVDLSPAAGVAATVAEPVVTTPLATSFGPLTVPGVDYDVDPKLWTVSLSQDVRSAVIFVHSLTALAVILNNP